MKIFCKDSARQINKRDCLPDRTSHACKTCPYKKARNINKNKYRIKSYTPPKKKITIDKKRQSLLNSISKHLKKNSTSPLNELWKLFYEIGQKGANLDVILFCLDFSQQNPEKGLIDSEKYNERIKSINNPKKSISGRFSLIIKIPPIQLSENIPDEFAEVIKRFNELLEDEKKRLEIIRQGYLKILEQSEIYNLPVEMQPMGFLPFKGLKRLKRNTISAQINKKIIPIVDELIRIGYSKNQAYKITGKLLNLSYKNYYKDPDPDIVRERYRHHKNKPSKNIL